MSEGLLKKIIGAILVPIVVAILGWATWVTKQAFSAQRTEVVLENHKIEAAKEQTFVRGEFKSLNEKIDVNQTQTYKMLLNIYKQNGGTVEDDPQ